jgi:hypothetical protein
MDVGLILGEMDVLPKRRLNKRSSISNSIAGKSIAVDCFSYQWQLEIGIRQGQVYGAINTNGTTSIFNESLI